VQQFSTAIFQAPDDDHICHAVCISDVKYNLKLNVNFEILTKVRMSESEKEMTLPPL
jgi:hypothetical protein